MRDFSWDTILTEAKERCSTLLDVITAICCRREGQNIQRSGAMRIPPIGTIYSLLLHQFNSELNHVQRINTVILSWNKGVFSMKQNASTWLPQGVNRGWSHLIPHTISRGESDKVIISLHKQTLLKCNIKNKLFTPKLWSVNFFHFPVNSMISLYNPKYPCGPSTPHRNKKHTLCMILFKLMEFL